MITLDDAIRFLNIAETNIDDVSIVEDIINEVTSQIEYVTGVKFLVGSVTNRFIGDGYKYYNLFSYKTNSITTVKYRETSFDIWNTLTNTDYVLNQNNTIYNIVFKNELKKDYEYEIVSNQGVTISNIPADLQKVAREMVYIEYFNYSKDYLGKSNISDNNINSSIGTTFIDLTPKWKIILKRYTQKRMTSGNY